MSKSTSTKQYFIYSILVGLTAVSTFFLYKRLNEEWILFRQGEKKYTEKDFIAAVSLYKEAINKGLAPQKVNVELANAFVALGNFNEATELYREHLNSYPDDQTVRLALAKALSWIGKQEEAEVEFKKILEGKNEKQSKNSP